MRSSRLRTEVGWTDAPLEKRRPSLTSRNTNVDFGYSRFYLTLPSEIFNASVPVEDQSVFDKLNYGSEC